MLWLVQPWCRGYFGPNARPNRGASVRSDAGAPSAVDGRTDRSSLSQSCSLQPNVEVAVYVRPQNV